MPRYFIEFSYEGLNYHGLQKQPNSETIQECVELNMSKFLGSSIDLTFAGRTDSGVHARHFANVGSPRGCLQIFLVHEQVKDIWMSNFRDI